MKKHITRLLFAALLLLALCIGASAAGTSGKCGPSAYWSFDSSTGTLTISGSGAMNDYEYGNDYPWMDYRDSIQTIVIGDQITQIGRYAFTGTACSTIKFGKNVRSIGAEAFNGCRNLSGDLTLPDSVQIVGDRAFSGCTGLNGTLTLGSSLQTIGAGAFHYCPFSGDLVIPDNVTSIGDSAFYISDYLRPETQGTLTLGKNLRTIGKEAFSGCAFTGSLTIPEGITEIADGTFSSLYQSSGMFTGKLTLPSTLKTIGASAFSYTDFSGELLIPDGVTSIGANAFKECDGFGGLLSLPDSVKTVEEWAFYLCKGFTGLKLSASLTKIEERSFAHMYGLKTEVVIPEGVTEIGEGAFSCSHMPSVRFPSTLKKIGKQAFYLTFGLTNYSTITFPNGLEVIEDEAFESCYFKNAVVLPAGIKSIGKKVFDGYRYSGKRNDIPFGVYFLGDAPQLVGTLNANCSFPSDWTLFYLPGTSGWTGDTYEGYKIVPWDGETRWDNLYTREFGYRDNNRNEIEASWSVNTDTGKITLTDDLNEGCVVAVSYDAEGRVTGIGVLRTKTDSVILNLQDTCRLFLLNASSSPRLDAPVTINYYIP